MSDPHPQPLHARAPLWLRVIFGVLHRIAPPLAARWAARLFGRPRRRRLRMVEREGIDAAESLWLNANGTRLRAWIWGEGERTVVLHHGWGGRGPQLAGMAAPLVRAGCRVLAYDAPAHGESSGRLTHLVDMTDTLLALERKIGPIDALITHSMGGMVAARALQRGLSARAVVAIAPPGEMMPYLDLFARALGPGPALAEGIHREMERQLGLGPRDVTAETLGAGQSTPLLLVYDEDDRDVPAAHALRWARAWPEAQVRRTAGLGHRAILHDPAVIGWATDFVLGRLVPDRP